MFSVRFRLPGLLAASLLALAVRLGAESTITPAATGRESLYDGTTKELILRGDARLTYGDRTLTADEIRYDGRTHAATARGNFVLTAGRRRLVADEGTYNFDTNILHVHHLRMGQFPVYLTGDTVDGTLDDLVITNATIFFRENAAYSPSIKAARLVYQKDRIVSMEGLQLGLLGRHFISLPKLEQDLRTEVISYLDGQLGYQHNLGAFVDLALRVPVAPGVRVGAEAGLYTARGLLIGPTASYNSGSGDTFVRGSLNSGYIRDFGNRQNDVLGNPVPPDRSYLEWRHQQQIGEHFTLDGEFNYWRDSEILRDFRPDSFFNVQQPDSFLEGAYAGNNFLLSAFVRVQPNHFELTQERLPEVRFDLLPTATPLPGLYERLSASYVMLQQDAFQNLPGLRSNRFDAFYGLERPLAPTPWFTFTPVAGGRYTYYADAVNGRSNYTRALGEVGFDALLRAAGTFDYKNELWDIDGLRHLIQPRLSYRYAPEASAGQAFLPAIDRQVFTTYLPPLDIGDQRNIDQLAAMDTLRFSLGNVLQTRDASGNGRNLAELNLAADYNFSHQAGTRPLGDLYSDFALTPAPWIRLEAFEHFTPQTGRQQELNYAVEITDQDWWSVRLRSYFLRNNYEQYNLDYRQRINEVFEVTGRWRYDARLGRMDEQTYGVGQRLGQTWALRYEVSFSRGPRREGSFGINVAAELLKF
ncbi:MAG: LPS-assembly protein LptD [Opitutales bacterium]